MDAKTWINPIHMKREFNSFEGVRVLDDFLIAEKEAGLSRDVRDKLTYTEIYGRYNGRNTEVPRKKWETLPDELKFYCYQQARVDVCPDERHYVNNLETPWSRHSIVYWLA